MTDRPAARPADRQEDGPRPGLPALGQPGGDAGSGDGGAIDDTGDFADEHNEAWVSEESPEGLDEPEAPEGHSGLEPTNRPY